MHDLNRDLIRAGLALWLTVGIVASLGCREAGAIPQSNVADGMAGSSASEPKDELEALFGESIAWYDRLAMSTCPCFVEQGGYDSVDECVRWMTSRDDWVSCGADALRPHDSPELRANIRCVEERARGNIECNTKTACGGPERADCTTSLVLCFVEMPDVVLELDAKCPDFALLTRQPTGEAGGSE